MIFLVGISAGVGDEEGAVVVGDTLRFVAHLHCVDGLERCGVDFCHKTACEGLCPGSGGTFMAVGGDVEVGAVGGKAAIVGHIFGASHSLALFVDELDDVRPVDRDGYQVLFHLDDILGGISKFIAIHVAKPLVAHHVVIFEIGKSAIVRLPRPFVHHDETLLGREWSLC